MNINQVLKFMRSNAEDFRDPTTGEINATGLAEAAAAQFNIYEDREYTIPEKVFELALRVA